MNIDKVSFKGKQIEVIRENQEVIVKDICEALGLAFKPQYTKLQSDETYQSKLIKVQTNGGMQEVFCIPLSKLNGWLFSINPNRVKPEVREKLIEYKNECFDVLSSYFNKGYAMQPEVKEALELKITQLQDAIMSQNTLIAKLYNELQAKPKLLPHTNNEVKDLKRTLIKVHDGYHKILTTCSPIDMMKELEKMTNLFQLIKSTNDKNLNLNTQTIARHAYWN